MSIGVGETRSIYLSSGSNTQTGNLTFTAPNIYTYNFTTPWDLNAEQYEASVDQLTIPFSWINVSSTYDNNSFSYIFNSQTRVMTLPDGFYQYSPTQNDLLGFMQAQMLANGDYLLNAEGNPEYYISVSLNIPLYAITFTLDKIPSVLPSGYTNPASITLSGETPQIVIPSTNIQNWLGFTAGTFPASPASVQTFVTSDLVPSNQQVSNVLVNMSGVFNSLISNYSNTIYSFSSAGASYGMLISPNIYKNVFMPFLRGYYTSFTFTLVDQSGAPLQIVDSTQFFVVIQIKRKR